MPRIDPQLCPADRGCDYPDPHAAPIRGRTYRDLAGPLGMAHLGASHVTLAPGAWSSQRHWHADEDELIVILSGTAVLIEDGGETSVGPGDVLLFPAGVADGHHLVNRGGADCTMVAVSAGHADGRGTYSDIDMTWAGPRYYRKDGTAYPPQERRVPE